MSTFLSCQGLCLVWFPTLEPPCTEVFNWSTTFLSKERYHRKATSQHQIMIDLYSTTSKKMTSSKKTEQTRRNATEIIICLGTVNSIAIVWVKELEPYYENTPIQIYWKFYSQKRKKIQIKNSVYFHISAQNIDCGYSLEPPRRGGSNDYPQSMFLSRNKKNNVYPWKPQFYYIKVGFKGVKII